jgi:beta-lactam-binding protein with PASTA domain
MPFNIFGFVINRTVAEQAGVADPSTANRLAIVGGLFGNLTTGVVLTSVLARREADSFSPANPGVPVPFVKHKDLAEATTVLVGQGLEFEVEPVPSSDPLQNDLVTDQDPEPGSLAASGSVVTLFVAKVAQVPVPNVVSDSETGLFVKFDKAREILQDQNFKVIRKDDTVSDENIFGADTVTATEPPPETLVEPESTVTVIAIPSPSNLQASGTNPKQRSNTVGARSRVQRRFRVGV